MKNIKIPFCVNIEDITYEQYCELYDYIAGMYSRNAYDGRIPEVTFIEGEGESFIGVDEDNDIIHWNCADTYGDYVKEYTSIDEFYNEVNPCHNCTGEVGSREDQLLSLSVKLIEALNKNMYSSSTEESDTALFNAYEELSVFIEENYNV